MSKHLPEIDIKDINPKASIAHFICYMHNEGVAVEDIAARAQISEEEVNQIVADALEVEIYADLINDFLVK